MALVDLALAAPLSLEPPAPFSDLFETYPPITRATNFLRTLASTSTSSSVRAIPAFRFLSIDCEFRVIALSVEPQHIQTLLIVHLGLDAGGEPIVVGRKHFLHFNTRMEPSVQGSAMMQGNFDALQPT